MKKLEKRILAEGETTGHAHVVDCDVYQEDDIRTFSATKPATITHEEHHEVKLPPNDYNSDKVVEFDHIQKVSRKATD